MANSCRGWIGCLFCIIFLNNVLPIYGQLAEVEQAALLDLVNTFSRVPTTWNANDASNACQWTNIICSEDQTTIVSMRILESNLGGYIPSSLGNLTNLQELNIDRAGITGTVPESVLLLPNLAYMSLENNRLTGNLSDFTKMPALRQLGLGNNTFYGTIPEFNAELLESLSLYRNLNLTGTLPTWLFQSQTIAYINLGYSRIFGTIPEMNMPNLNSLTMSNMNITGTIPPLDGVPELKELYGLEFDFDSSNDICSYLIALQVSGTMPNMTKLVKLTSIELFRVPVENCFTLPREPTYCRIQRTNVCSDCVPAANCTMADNGVCTLAPVIFAPDGSIIPPGSATPPVNPPGGLSQEGTIAIAVVIPVVVAGLAVFLIIFFVKKNNKKKKGKKLDRSQSDLPEWLKTNKKTTNPNFELLEKEVMKLPQKLFTPYEQITVKNLLGVGSFGQVFEGEWQKSKVALKISLSQVSDSFIEEIKLVADMRPHPNIVQLLGYSIHPDNLNMILIMEFCNGGSLDVHLFDSNRELSVLQKLDLTKGIALGLTHLHANGIVHRDIAARNILLSNGVPKLSDFGMSRQLDGDKKRGTTKADTGPVRWMAPESLKTQEYSTHSDVWMFGVLMFEVFAQSEPHANEDPLEVGIKIRNEGYTPQLTPNIPLEVSDIMKRCWSLDPEQRPTMAEIVTLVSNLEQK